jgi:outer membrane protein insertion porin family
MRFSKVATYSLSALSISALAHPAQAAQQFTGVVQSPTAAIDVVVATEAPTELPAQATISRPETIAAQPEFSKPEVLNEVAKPITIAARMSDPAPVELSALPEKLSPIDRYRAAHPLVAEVEPIAVKPIVAAPIVIATQPAPKFITQPAVKPTPKPAPKPSINSTAKPGTTLSETVPTLTTDVKILGIEPELQDVARQVLLTQPGKPTTATIVREDRDALLETGLFISADATTQLNPKGVDVTFNLAPVIAKSIQLINAKALTQDTATAILKPQLGKPVQPSLLNQGVRDLQQWYNDQGYNLARVVGLNSKQDGTLNVTVVEGEVSDVKIRFIDDTGRSQDDKGNAIKGRTQESLIRQSIQLKKGSAFKESDAQDDLNRLFKTGLFQGGRVTLEGDVRNATVVYNLAELPLRRTDIGGGYNSDVGLNASVSYRDFNFGGLGQQVGGSVIVGSKDFQFDGRFANPYRETQPDTWGYSVQASRNRGLSRVFDGDVKLNSGNDVREGRFGGAVNFSKPIAPSLNATVGLGYTRVSTRDTNGDLMQQDSGGNPLSLSGTGLDDLYTVSAGISQDKRDNILDPKSGSLLSLSSEQYVPIGVGNVFANRVSANYSQYVPVNLFGSTNPKTKDILAFNVQGGTTIGDLPPSQAYLLGGVNSVRGYEQGKVGIGKSYALASAEYRFPILNETVGGTLFADYGTDLGSSAGVIGDPGLQRNRSGSGFGYGAGLRVNSPLGLLRADLGFNDRGENRIQFGVGQKF